eukprot:CAMPEP_0206445808 /NCGR_PEP_ID=MMETSP0324_2-20121206/15744_1 /ASSEMBLY_ACC=CAM_ASM_000836 /TAXON_ID=2866 /ORGANISM="Crypthecodinium cohnii, Strain Seligo" /LENGTH=370 /DNA_ID=CAMNT_0053914125 /DNA_START=80 /DNA_END=1192 /DNA_ORIENTATION=-
MSNAFASTLALAGSSVALGAVLAALAWTASQRAEELPLKAKRRLQKLLEEEGDDEEGGPRVGRRRSIGKGGAAAALAADDEEDYWALRCGFSMEQARIQADEEHEVAKSKTPQQVLVDMQKGNARFWMGMAQRPEKTAFQRRALITKQYPSVAILGCSDSRVPTEIIFDQGLGDMFVIRVAGNCLRLQQDPSADVVDTGSIDTTTSASLQYAVKHLKVKLVVIMGHEGCGAVKASQLPLEAIGKEPVCLQYLLKGLRSGLNLGRLSKVRDAKAHDREAVVTNVKRQVEKLTEDPVFMEQVAAGELIIVGAFYEISSGIVDFFHEVSEDTDGQTDLSPINRGVARRPSRGVLTRLNTKREGGFEAEDDQVS